MNKFIEEFKNATSSRFEGIIKFKNAVFVTEKKHLSVTFLISRGQLASFTDDQKDIVKKAVERILPGLDTEIIYERAYADEGVVRGKVFEFFNLYNQIIFKRLSSRGEGKDPLSVTVEGGYIEVVLELETPIYEMLNADAFSGRLKNYLDTFFTESIEIRLRETSFDPSKYETEGEKLFMDTEGTASGLRLIDAKLKEKIYSRGKGAGIGHKPGFIADAKSGTENAVLCGKVSGLEKRFYKNKKYDPSKPEGDRNREQNCMVKFFLNDKTAPRLECVIFPNSEEIADAVMKFADDEGTVFAVSGNLSTSTYSGTMSCMVGCIYTAEADFDALTVRKPSPLPKSYKRVFPEPYQEERQASIFGEVIPSFLMDKTFVVFDLETTGVNIASDEPTEIAAAKMQNGHVLETFQTLVKPGVPISAEVTKLTGITNEMVEYAPAFKDIVPDFFRFAHGSVLVGHNIDSFDLPILTRLADPEGFFFTNDTADTLTLARRFLKDAGSYSLESLSKKFSISHDNAHRALSDVLATAALLKVIAEKMS